MKGKFPIKRRIESKVGFTREGERERRRGIQQNQARPAPAAFWPVDIVFVYSVEHNFHLKDTLKENLILHEGENENREEGFNEIRLD